MARKKQNNSGAASAIMLLFLLIAASFGLYKSVDYLIPTTPPVASDEVPSTVFYYINGELATFNNPLIYLGDIGESVIVEAKIDNGAKYYEGKINISTNRPEMIKVIDMNNDDNYVRVEIQLLKKNDDTAKIYFADETLTSIFTVSVRGNLNLIDSFDPIPDIIFK